MAKAKLGDKKEAVLLSQPVILTLETKAELEHMMGLISAQKNKMKKDCKNFDWHVEHGIWKALKPVYDKITSGDC